MQQLNLNLQTTENFDPYSASSFVILDENSAAYHFLEKFFSQREFSRSQFPSLILKGAPSCGKSHLLNIFAKEFHGKFLNITEISAKNLDGIFSENRFFILENIDEIQNEELLLHLINSAVEAKAFLILSAKNNLHFQLKDLVSRLKNIFSLQIKEPSVEAIKILLINAFSRRQIKVSHRIIKLIATDIERSYLAIFEVVKLIEEQCHNSGKTLTMPTVKEILADMKDGNIS